MMYSIRNASARRRNFSARSFAAAATVGAMLCCGGCYVRQNPPPEASSMPPTDKAMALRQWPEVTAFFANGSTVAGHSRFPLEPDPKAPHWTANVTTTSTFIGNVFFFPVSYILFPPFTQKVYHPVAYEPTYTAVPPLPPSAAAPAKSTPGQTATPDSSQANR